MKNLELKVELQDFAAIRKLLSGHYIEDLLQTDTYFACKSGRLKLREEEGKQAYMIYYERPDISGGRYSDYYTFPIPDIEAFRQVFFPALEKELVVQKRRELYLINEPCHTRIHLDTVKELGNFLEIEIIVGNNEQNLHKVQLLPDRKFQECADFMEYLIHLLGLKDCPKIDCGYRELLVKQNSRNKNLEYYASTNKVFWVVNKDVNEDIHANDVLPCIFVEKTSDEYQILQLSESIKFDQQKYTAWRKLIGGVYGIHVDVLLVHSGKLFTLDNKEIQFANLGRSQISVDKKFLAPFALESLKLQ